MLKYISSFVLTTFLLVALTAFVQTDDKDNITIKQLKEGMENDSLLVILDVRMPQELEGKLGQIEGVINIPVQELEERLDELKEYRDNNIAIICRSGRRSLRATDLLKQKGFNVKNVLGGMIEYRQSEEDADNKED